MNLFKTLILFTKYHLDILWNTHVVCDLSAPRKYNVLMISYHYADTTFLFFVMTQTEKKLLAKLKAMFPSRLFIYPIYNIGIKEYAIKCFTYLYQKQVFIFSPKSLVLLLHLFRSTS